MKRLIFALLFAASLYAQTTVNVPTLTVSSEATAALNAVFATTVNGTYATLTAPVGIGDTTINVVSTAGIAATSACLIENEAVKITARTANTFTVTRAYYGTTAVAHPQTAVCAELKYPTFIKAFVQAIADFVGFQMDAANSSTIAAQNAVITAAQAAKAAAKASAVQ